MLPTRRPPRRTAGGLVAAALGALAGIGVLVILVMSMVAQPDEGQSGAAARQRTARIDKTAAAAGPIYRTGALTPRGCPLPAISPGDDTSMSRFMHRLTNCLDKSWAQQFGKAGGQRFQPPARTFWTGSGRSPCGSYPQPGAAAFYCPANNTMYIGLQNIVETSGNEPVSHYSVYARVIAHEYGHHVQNGAGILPYGHWLMDGQSAVDARNLTSRRIELQAQCFAGLFLGAERSSLPMTGLQYDAMIADVRGRGDDRLPADKHDHGSSRSYVSWLVRGYQRQAMDECNTWTAPVSAVD